MNKSTKARSDSVKAFLIMAALGVVLAVLAGNLSVEIGSPDPNYPYGGVAVTVESKAATPLFMLK